MTRRPTPRARLLMMFVAVKLCGFALGALVAGGQGLLVTVPALLALVLASWPWLGRAA